MTRLRPIKSRELARVLLRQGYVFRRQHGSHAIYYRATDKRRVTLPMHNRDLRMTTLRSILDEMGITPEEFERMR